MVYQPKTGQRCTCKRGVQRDNCPDCEGTGWRIDFKAIRNRRQLTATEVRILLGDPEQEVEAPIVRTEDDVNELARMGTPKREKST